MRTCKPERDEEKEEAAEEAEVELLFMGPTLCGGVLEDTFGCSLGRSVTWAREYRY